MDRERILLSIMIAILFVSVGITIVQAEYQVQPAKEHSGICTNDGKMWDNNFAKLVNGAVKGNCKEMIFTFGQCFGGGMIDDLNKTVNAKMALSSASRHNETSEGCPLYKRIAKTDADCYLKAWAEAINKAPLPTMKQAYAKATNNDPAGPKGAKKENPQYKSKGVNADNLKLGNKSGATSYYAILFVGGPDEWRHWNDLERIHKVLKNKYGYTENNMYILYNNKKLKDGTATPNWVDSIANNKDLKNAFNTWLKPKMNKNVQFFFWCGDHGSWKKTNKKIVYVPCYGSATYTFTLDESVKKSLVDTFVSLETYNVTSTNDTVYLNDKYIGNLTFAGLNKKGCDILYFDEGIINTYNILEVKSTCDIFVVNETSIGGTGSTAMDVEVEKEVTFDLADEVVIGDKVNIQGDATSGTHVDVYVDDTLYDELDDLIIEDGEFSKVVKTTNVGMTVPGSVRLKAWIDCDKVAGEERPTRSPDGEGAILVSHTLTAYLSVPAVALEDDFTVFGTAQGQSEVVILSVPPKGGGGKSLLDRGQKGLSERKASVSTTDDTYSKKMQVQEDATADYYDIYVLCAGMDDEWGMTGQENLVDALDVKYNIPSLDSCIICTKTQEDIDDILDNLINTPGADDLMVKLRLKVEMPYVRLDPVASVNAGQPLVVTGESNRQDGYTIVITCIGVTMELAPQTVQVENGTFRATFDTTDAVTGEYMVKADDGDGHTDEADVHITGAGMQEREAAVKEAEEVVKEILATPTPTPEPTPQPPGF